MNPVAMTWDERGEFEVRIKARDLVHSYTYDAAGRIRAADIITPTAMNAAMLETHLRAAVGVSDPQDEAALKRRLEMVARAYDPCISCSVHVVRL